MTTLKNAPLLGQIVIFVPEPNTPAAHNNATHVPAVVVRSFSPDIVNLKVLTDGPETVWITSVKYDREGNTPRTWNFGTNPDGVSDQEFE